jgi:hypothetical protein
MAHPSHYILAARTEPDACVLDRFPSIRSYIWQATEGEVASTSFPDGVELRMSARAGGKAVRDVVRNTLGMVILSARARAVLDTVARAPMEYLPLVIIDHKGRRSAQPTFIANVLGRVDCVDLSASAFEESSMRAGEFFSLSKLVLDPKRIDPQRNLFRIAQWPRLILVSDEVASALTAADLSGLDLIDPAGPLEV